MCQAPLRAKFRAKSTDFGCATVCVWAATHGWTMPLLPHADKTQPSFGAQLDRHDRPYTSLGNGHGNNGTPPCGKSRCIRYQNDKKHTGIQTSGKSR